MHTATPLLLLLLLLAGCATQADPEPVVPGERLGAVTLGLTRTAVHTALGEPAEVHEVAGYVIQVWNEPDEGRLFVFFRDDVAVQVAVNARRYATADGISTNSTLADIRRQYPEMQAFLNPLDPSGTYYDAIDAGLAFMVSDPVGEMAANPAGEAITLIVHAPGEEVIIL